MSMPLAAICKGCWQKMGVPIPLGGVLSLPFRMFGIRRSRMNPNTCTICELMFSRVMKARKVAVDVTVMFADLRGYTSLSQTLAPEAMSGLLDTFYDVCATAIWEHDGLLNKTIGDAVMAVFNFPIPLRDHARQAVLTARAIQSRCHAQRETLIADYGISGTELGVGIGIDSGEVSFGEFGRSHRDLTAIGTVVNTAARAQSAAAPGQILVTKSVFERSGPDMADSHVEEFRLKGFDAPMPLYTA